MKMFKFNNIIKSATILAFSALVSCVEMEDPQSGAVGTLAVPSVDVDVTVYDLAQTKAIDFEIEAPAVADVHFVVKDKDGNVKYDGDGLWTEPVVMPVGAYTIEATHGENGFGGPYFTGSYSGIISALGNEVPAVSLALGNALVNVNLDSDFAAHFTGEKVTMASGTVEKAFGEWFYVPSDTDVALELVGTNSAGKGATFTHTLTSPVAKTAYSVVCGKETTDWPSVSLSVNAEEAWASRIYITTPASFSGNISTENQSAVVYEAIPSSSSDWSSPATAVSEDGVLVIKGLTTGTEYQVRARVGTLVSNVVKVTPSIDGFSATASHTYTSGELDGTDVTATFSKPDVVKNGISSWTINLCKSDGTVLREGLPLGISDGSAITATDGWPYLPVGSGESYVVKASAVVDGQTYTLDDISLDGLSTPDFSLVMSSYTSYDKYAGTNNITKVLTNTEATGANQCDPATLYNAGAQWGISVNLMKNTNYAKTLVINIDGNTYRTFNVTGDYQDNKYYEKITDLAWSAHTLAVSVTFDGKTVSKEQTHHITGLPYDLTHPAQGWSIVENGAVTYTYFGDEYIFLTSDSSTGSVKTPDFHVPSSIDIFVSSTFKRIRDGIAFDWKYSIHTYDSSGNTSEIASDEGNGKNTVHTISGNANFTSSCYNILCRRYYWGGSGPDAQITNLSIDYR